MSAAVPGKRKGPLMLSRSKRAGILAALGDGSGCFYAAYPLLRGVGTFLARVR